MKKVILLCLSLFVLFVLAACSEKETTTERIDTPKEIDKITFTTFQDENLEIIVKDEDKIKQIKDGINSIQFKEGVPKCIPDFTMTIHYTGKDNESYNMFCGGFSEENTMIYVSNETHSGNLDNETSSLIKTIVLESKNDNENKDDISYHFNSENYEFDLTNKEHISIFEKTIKNVKWDSGVPSIENPHDYEVTISNVNDTISLYKFWFNLNGNQISLIHDVANDKWGTLTFHEIIDLYNLISDTTMDMISKNPNTSGYIVAKDDSRLLVVSSVKEDFSETGGVSEYHNAIWFATDEVDSFKLGEKIHVWHGMVLTSYPGQSGALKIERIQPETPDGAQLNEQDVVSFLLNNHFKENKHVLIIKSVLFDKSKDTWFVIVKQDENEQEFEVKDIN